MHPSVLLFALLSCLLFLPCAEAEPSFGCAELALEQPKERKKAHFTQERHIAALSKPLLSSGELSLLPGEEIIWNTTSPIQSRVVIRAQGIEVEAEGSAYHEQLEARHFRELSRILLSLHSLDEQSLAENFTLECNKTEEGKFTIRAVPSRSELQDILARVEISGGKFPEHIRITDARGELTVIDLEYQLDDAEQVLETESMQ